MARSVKLIITGSGSAALAPPTAKRGYSGRNPVVEIADVPEAVGNDEVLRTYERCVIVPLMHAETAIPWRLIANATDGKIVRLTRGRPEKAANEKLSARVSIKLDPDLAERWARTPPAEIRDILREHLPPLSE